MKVSDNNIIRKQSYHIRLVKGDRAFIVNIEQNLGTSKGVFRTRSNI